MIHLIRLQRVLGSKCFERGLDFRANGDTLDKLYQDSEDRDPRETHRSRLPRNSPSRDREENPEERQPRSARQSTGLPQSFDPFVSQEIIQV
jgi:hypothetical protein